MDDTTLIDRAARGDAAARRRLVEQHQQQVWALCRRLAAEPEDAYQAAWEKVFGALGRFSAEGPATLATWIHTVARRTLVDLHRRAAVRGPVLAAVDAEDPRTAGAAEAQADAAALWAAIERLPPDQKHAVVGHHVHGEALEALAAEAGVAVGTIKSRLHRGRANLLAMLEGR